LVDIFNTPLRLSKFLTYTAVQICGATAAYRFQLLPPTADPEIVDRWFNTDVLAKESARNDLLSFAELQNKSVTAIKDIATEWKAHGSYHPAVTDFRITAEWCGVAGSSKVCEVSVGQAIGSAATSGFDIQRVFPVMVVKCGQVSELTCISNQRCEIEVPVGEWVRITISPVVRADQVTVSQAPDTANTRLAITCSSAAVNIDGIAKLVLSDVFAEYYFEQLPVLEINEWNDEVFRIEVPTVTSPRLVAAKINKQDASFVNWVAGVKMQRHEWHWAGYDFVLPVGDRLIDWVPAMAGAATYRQSSDATLSVSWDLQPDTWHIASQTVATLELPAERGARYVTWTFTPIPRFNDWLKISVRERFSSKIAAVGACILGVAKSSYDTRVPAPNWAWDLPLCETYTAADDKLARALNGNLLVFDDAIRRTDDLARLGGLGEVIDLEIVESRVADLFEKGVNPIFHANEQINFDVHPQSVFGLSYDIGPNAKIVQTGIIVTPINANGKWVMAKMRARRMYLPELMNDSELVDNVLVSRLEGNLRLPADFCVDIPEDAPLPLSLSMTTVAGISLLDVVIPPGWEATSKISRKRRIIVSWHPGKSPAGDATLFPQLVLQERADNALAWKSQQRKNMLECAADPAQVPFEIRLQGLPPIPLNPPVNYLVRRILLSSYTDARWLTFIGSFGNALQTTLDYRLRPFIGGTEDAKSEQLHLEKLVGGRWIAESLSIRGPTNVDASSTTFQLLLTFQSASDLMRGRRDETAGLIDDFFEPVDGKSVNIFRKFGVSAVLPSKMNEGSTRHAYLMSFQRINTQAPYVSPANWGELLAGMFPEQNREATYRLLPEYLGAIAIINKGS
jgi:hypothetical protein